MAIVRQVINGVRRMTGSLRRLTSIALLVIFLLTVVSIISNNFAFANPSAPTVLESDWRTGELEVKWCGVTPGNAITVYTAKWDSANVYSATDVWTADTACGSHIVQAFENGQTIFYYIVQIDSGDGTISPPSNSFKQTPPITAYIINWPELIASLPPPVDNTSLLEQIKDAINSLGDKIDSLNNDLSNKIDSAFTPSDAAKTELQNAITDVKNSIGVGQVETIGNDLKTAIDGGHSGMATPVNNDDGTHTFTGGATPDELLALDSGTDTPITFRIPLTQDMNHNPVYVKIFTAEQMEKLQWLTVLRKVATYTIWIIFAFWVITRFTPAFKV